MNNITILMAALSFCMGINNAQAAVSLDRTRAVYDGNSKSISLNVSNENKQFPYLAQAWLEDKDMKKIVGPLTITPPIQRLEPGAKSMVRISALPEVNKLPQDRETLFYFNLREIPPRSDKPNVMQIALQTKIKLYYRPAAIMTKPGEVWQDKLVLHKTLGGYNIENPTPYYVVVADISGQAQNGKKNEFTPVLIEPKSTQKVSSVIYDSPVITYINDYGGRPSLPFNCEMQTCRAEKQ